MFSKYESPLHNYICIIIITNHYETSADEPPISLKYFSHLSPSNVWMISFSMVPGSTQNGLIPAQKGGGGERRIEKFGI